MWRLRVLYFSCLSHDRVSVDVAIYIYTVQGWCVDGFASDDLGWE